MFKSWCETCIGQIGGLYKVVLYLLSFNLDKKKTKSKNFKYNLCLDNLKHILIMFNLMSCLAVLVRVVENTGKHL